MELLTRVAFFLAMVIVCARVGMGEALRDLMPVGPGTVAAPKGAGPATSLFLDLLCCVPAMLDFAAAGDGFDLCAEVDVESCDHGGAGGVGDGQPVLGGGSFAAMVSSADLAAGLC
jgi:hypothetical protein